MAKRRLDSTAESIGASLGQLAARLDAWKAQRRELAAEVRRLLHSAQNYLNELGGSAEGELVTAPPSPRNKGGRPKGYKMSAATKAKLRAAWKRRKAAMTTAKAGASAARAGAKTLVRGKRKKAAGSDEAGNS